MKRCEGAANQFGDNIVGSGLSVSCVETDVSRKGRGKEKK
jgi:hypothetical protein